MVCARLHLICGNCGCNDMWEWEYHKKEFGEDADCVYLTCTNCSTLHDINDSATCTTDIEGEGKL